MWFIYLLAVNTVCLLLFFIDKRRARAGRYRIPERTLFLWAVIGGAAGGWLGMYLFRHKTRHGKFTFGFPLLLLLQGVLIYFITRTGI